MLSVRQAILFIATLFSFFQLGLAANSSSSAVQYVTSTDAAGDTIYLADNRQPALYTGNFGDCLGNSLINVSRFDAAYYQDNMTVLFHVSGNSALANESIMMYIGVYAYGESRFDLTFNPCNANINSLCPVNSSVPIVANAIIPVGENDVFFIPSIAFSIPDFEGIAVLRIFANSTESEIGCYSAVMSNGNSFSHPSSVGTILGIFTIVALLASFATAAYGDSIPVMRSHYAHSLSVLVVFAVFQHIFFTGVLSMNWPSVLPAWWSNFAWAGGMIYTSSMQNSINHLIGNNIGNTSEVGAAGSGTSQTNVGGGYDISSIYKRSVDVIRQRDIGYEIYGRDRSDILRRDVLAQGLERSLFKRDDGLANRSSGYDWYGYPVGEGLPLPGNYSGFAGTLAQEGIRVSNAFMTGFLWFLILLVIVVGTVVAFKWILEGLVAVKMLRKNRLTFFRQNWTGYSGLAALRTLYIGFFMMMLLTMFQFSFDSSGGVKAIAGLVFAIFLIGIPGCVIYAYYYRAQSLGAQHHNGQNPLENHTKMQRLGAPFKAMIPTRNKTRPESASSGVAFWRLSQLHEDPHPIHEDEDYTKKFGWLAARFRRTRWWFFGAWTFYEFLRACFYGGASGHPLTQVFGLLVVEILAFAFIVWARPFEGKRLNVLVVYFLGFSKVATVALSAAFDINFNLPRIATTAIGIIIIVIQGILTIVTLIAIVIGAISSYMSLTRNRDEFKPKKWAGIREKYFVHLDRVAADVPRPAPPPPEEPKGPYFNVSSVRRVNKIEDDDEDLTKHMRAQDQDPAASYISLQDRPFTPAGDGTGSPLYTPTRGSRAMSSASIISGRGNLPFGARAHRASWSSRDFSQYHPTNEDSPVTPINMSRNIPDDNESPITPVGRQNRSATMPTKMRTVTSHESLRVGGNVSSQDVIGKVPMPTSRPRSGTWNSRAPSRNGTPTPSIYNTEAGGLDVPGERRSKAPLTPALEQDEIFRTSTNSNR